MAERSVLNNKELKSDIDAMRNLCDDLESMMQSGQTWQDFIETHKYNNTGLREFLRDLQSVKSADNKAGNVEYPVHYGPWDYGLTQGEMLYKAIFKMGERDMPGVTCIMSTGKKLPSDLNETLEKLMSKTLSEREQDIVRRHANGETFESIGENYKLTRERIRQLYEQALNRLRRPEYLEIIAKGYKQYYRDVSKKKPIHKDPVMVRDFRDLPSYNIPCMSRAMRCIRALELKTVGEVEDALGKGRLRDVKGFGNASDKSIRQGLNSLYIQYTKGEIA